jgi:hypothetical protein
VVVEGSKIATEKTRQHSQNIYKQGGPANHSAMAKGGEPRGILIP